MPSESELRRRLSVVLNRTLALNVTETELEQSQSLEELMAADSMAILQLLLGIEREFGIRFPPEDIELGLLKDMRKLLDYIAARMG